jgi:hypothetical protein
VDMKEIRDSDAIRKHVKAQVDELSDKLGWWYDIIRSE